MPDQNQKEPVEGTRLVRGSLDDVPEAFHQGGEGCGIAQGALDGDNSTQIITNNNIINNNCYDKRELETRICASLKFEPWVRKTASFNQNGLEAQGKLNTATAAFLTENFIGIQTSLASFGEDAFELLSSLPECHGKKRLRAAPLLSDIDDSFNSADLFLEAEPEALLYIDLRTFKEELHIALNPEPDSPEAHQLAYILKNRGSFAVLVSLPNADSSLEHQHRIVFSYAEEEEILVRRASLREGKPEPLIGKAIREELARFMWGKTPCEQLRNLDHAIRSGAVRQRSEHLQRLIAKIDKEADEYVSRLEYLLGNDRNPESDHRKNALAKIAWPFEMTSAFVEHALFVLTNFEGLTPLEFNDIISKLLSAATSRRGLTTRQPQTPLSPWTAGAQQQPAETDTHYSDMPDQLLGLIDVHLNENGRLDFATALKKQIAEERLQLNKAIGTSRLLLEVSVDKCFIFDLPIHIARQIAGRYADCVLVASRNGPEAGGNALLALMARLTRGFADTRDPGEVPRAATADVFKVLFQLLDPSSSRDRARKIGREYTERISLVLTRLLANPNTRPLIDRALDSLKVEGEGSEARHYLILQFVRILGTNPGFRTLFWLKRLLAEGDQDSKRGALDYLARGIEKGRRDGDDDGSTLLQTLLSWLAAGTPSTLGLNNRTAALLAPRIAIHRAFAKIRDEEHGTVDRLIPLFDISRDDGLPSEIEITMRLLTAPIDGPWIREDISLVSQLISARWEISDRAPHTNPIRGANAALAEFPALTWLEVRSATGAWSDADSRCLCLAALLIEAVAIITGIPGRTEARRLGAANSLIRVTSASVSRNSLFAISDQCYSLSYMLKRSHSVASQRRGECARWIGDSFYRMWRAAAENKRAQTIRCTHGSQ